ncbi:MAG TPA: hypothetical protein VFB59_00390 [Candidatus Saccharimonadales bacterium]|nr:hypothetical protein [Candidatus Saccharimonadales bacterium]
MTQDNAKKKDKKSVADKNFTDTVKIMGNTPPISNEEIIKRNKKRKK